MASRSKIKKLMKIWEEKVIHTHQQNVSLYVKSAVGVVLELLGLAAVNVVPPITDQSDLIKKLKKDKKCCWNQLQHTSIATHITSLNLFSILKPIEQIHVILFTE